MLQMSKGMEKGLDIAFQLNGRDDRNTVLALADLTGNFFATHLDIQWRVFHVTLGDQKYYRILFTGKGTGRLHPGVHREIREKFDALSHMKFSDLMKLYEEQRRMAGFLNSRIMDLKEEYDLWQDRLWDYI